MSGAPQGSSRIWGSRERTPRSATLVRSVELEVVKRMASTLGATTSAKLSKQVVGPTNPPAYHGALKIISFNITSLYIYIYIYLVHVCFPPNNLATVEPDKKKLSSFSLNLGCVIGILIMARYNPHITG